MLLKKLQKRYTSDRSVSDPCVRHRTTDSIPIFRRQTVQKAHVQGALNSVPATQAHDEQRAPAGTPRRETR